jgi:hypothetical protein
VPHRIDICKNHQSAKVNNPCHALRGNSLGSQVMRDLNTLLKGRKYWVWVQMLWRTILYIVEKLDYL